MTNLSSNLKKTLALLIADFLARRNNQDWLLNNPLTEEDLAALWAAKDELESVGLVDGILRLISEAHLSWPDETPFMEWPERVVEFKREIESIVKGDAK